jgi:class 3 adenylate cyclase
MNRGMAAILAADVVGYSRLMGVDEEGALSRLKAHRREQRPAASSGGSMKDVDGWNGSSP